MAGTTSQTRVSTWVLSLLSGAAPFTLRPRQSSLTVLGLRPSRRLRLLRNEMLAGAGYDCRRGMVSRVPRPRRQRNEAETGRPAKAPDMVPARSLGRLAEARHHGRPST